MKPIYLDYNATTPILPEVADEMRPFLDDLFGNPSSSHLYGQQTNSAVLQARERVASLIECHPGEIVFSSGGSEANNYAIKGIAFANQEKGNHIITSKIEHPAVIEVCEYLKKWGFEISYISVSPEGVVDVSELEASIRPSTILISMMHANNEVGTIQPLRDIATIARRRNIVFHSDGAQSVGKIPTSVSALGVDLFSIAGHKLYGPKGIGALYVRQGVEIEKLIHGAKQENGRRAGTENIMEIAALGKACEIAKRDLMKTDMHLKEMRDRLLQGIKNNLDNKIDIKMNGHQEQRLPNTLSLSFASIEANSLISDIEDRLAVSAGAACHSGGIDISATLDAMGVPLKYAMGTIRFSTGKPTTADEIDQVVEIIGEAVVKIRN